MAAQYFEQSLAPEPTANYDRIQELKQFDETKAGVKGLVDSGIKHVPRIFIQPPEDRPNPSNQCHDASLQVPVVDLDGFKVAHLRQKIIQDLSKASKSWGFFQLINHGLPITLTDSVIRGVRKFHEQDQEVKAKLYSRNRMQKVRFFSNKHLFTFPAANWSDTLFCSFDHPIHSMKAELPSVLRDEMVVYMEQVRDIAHVLCELLSEALGLDPHYLEAINATMFHYALALYYPPCPQPHLTLGTSKHSDPTLLTVLLQDDVGGLQVLHQNQWVDVCPIRGALVVNIGDFLQLISNDKFKSVEHRVVASTKGPRISVGSFFSPRINEEKPYGPIKEDEPPVYQQVLSQDFLLCYLKTSPLGESALIHYKL